MVRAVAMSNKLFLLSENFSVTACGDMKHVVALNFDLKPSYRYYEYFVAYSGTNLLSET
jgi:hypothetical protein